MKHVAFQNITSTIRTSHHYPNDISLSEHHIIIKRHVEHRLTNHQRPTRTRSTTSNESVSVFCISVFGEKHTSGRQHPAPFASANQQGHSRWHNRQTMSYETPTTSEAVEETNCDNNENARRGTS